MKMKEEEKWVRDYNSEPIKKLLKEIKPEDQLITSVNMLKEALEEADKENARLRSLIEKAYFDGFDSNVDEDFKDRSIEYWEQFKKDNNL
jgi:dissimilatory sulfite reductase (desulfoviridin) alpha/beta subunit